MIEFEPLASSSAGCCYVVRSGAHCPLLIDAGIRFQDIQRALSFRVSSLAGALISHGHGDHTKAIPALLGAGVEVYASADTWSHLGISGHRKRTIADDEEFRVGPWTVRAFEAVHDADGTLGFLIAGPEGGKLLYLTDTAYSKFRFPGVTHFCVEANHSREILRANVMTGRIDARRGRRTSVTHLSLERLIAMLKANDLSQVQEIWLLHLSDENADEDAFKDAVERATGKPVYVAAKRSL